MDGLFGDNCSTLYISIRPCLDEIVSLLFTITLGVRLGVLGQKMQSVLMSLRVSVVPSSLVILYVTLQFDMLPPALLHKDVGEVSFLCIHYFCFLFFFCDFFKIITVFFLSHVLKEYLVFSGHSDGVGDVLLCVKLLVPLVVCEIIMVKTI